jgi:serine/threonine-protein kinase
VSERYELLNIIGEGGMGKVYRAYDNLLKREIAIKILELEEKNMVEMLKREALITANLTHPFIVSMFDVGELRGKPFIAMELVEGRSLKEVMKEKIFEEEEIIKLALDLLSALSYAHSKGVIHRDIKPSNILITSSGHPKLADFGIAKAFHLPWQFDEEIMGSPSYMAPEVIDGSKYDHRVDLFSMGVVLYEMLCGKHPFRKKTYGETIKAIKKETPPPPSFLKDGIMKGWDFVISKAIAKNPDERYQNAQQFAEDIKRLKEIGKKVRGRKDAIAFLKLEDTNKTHKVFITKTHEARKERKK